MNKVTSSITLRHQEHIYNNPLIDDTITSIYIVAHHGDAQCCYEDEVTVIETRCYPRSEGYNAPSEWDVKVQASAFDASRAHINAVGYARVLLEVAEVHEAMRQRAPL